MREILFRGKCVEVGIYHERWLEGFYGEDDGKALISHNTDFGLVGYVCDPDTIGQYTGLKDKNGTRIFEGDIVTCNWFCGVVCFYEGAWCVPERGKYPEDLYGLINLEVIGNIHDNPELLEGDQT